MQVRLSDKTGLSLQKRAEINKRSASKEAEFIIAAALRPLPKFINRRTTRMPSLRPAFFAK